MKNNVYKLPPLQRGRLAPTVSMDRDAVGSLVDRVIQLRRVQRAFGRNATEIAGALDALERIRLGDQLVLTPQQQLAVLRVLREVERTCDAWPIG